MILLAAPGMFAGRSTGGMDGAGARLTRAEGLLVEGRPADALQEAEAGLELAPEHLDLLGLASKAAEANGRPDEALVYAILAHDVARDTPSRGALATEWAKRVARLDPLGSKGSALLDECGGTIFRLAEGLASRGNPGNAIDLFGRCRGTKWGARASAQIERLYANEKTVEALLDGTLDLPLQAPDLRSAEQREKDDASHFHWQDAWRIKRSRYNLVTNVNGRTAEAISLAMERMHRVFRSMPRRTERDDPWSPCTVRVYQVSEEYEKNEKGRPEGGTGFYSAADHAIAAFDPRWQANPRSELWRTLFREGFRAFAAKHLPPGIPPWLAEGGACSAEGARFLTDGTFETALLPEKRLQGARRALDTGTPTLEEVLSYSGPGDRPAGFDDLSWALVQFLLRYADDRSQWIYRPLLVEYAESFRAAGKGEPLARFEEHFVKRAKVPDVETFAEFSRRVRVWILAVHDIEFGPPERAEALVARGRKELADGNREAAMESFRWALWKRPDDAPALLGLADAEAGLRRRDAALLHFRRAIESSRRGSGSASQPASRPTSRPASAPTSQPASQPASPPATQPASQPAGRTAIVDPTLARIRSLDAPLADGLRPTISEWPARAASVAREYAGAGYAREALRVLDGVRKFVGEDAELRALRDEIAKASRVDTRRWRRLRLGEELVSWFGGYAQEPLESGILFDAERALVLFYKHEVPVPFRFEATVQPVRVEDGSAAVLNFGLNDETGHVSFGVHTGGDVALFRDGEGGPRHIQSFPKIAWDGKRAIRLAVDVSSDGIAELFVDDRSLGKLPLTRWERRGGIGIALQSAKAEFRDLRVKS